MKPRHRYRRQAVGRFRLHWSVIGEWATGGMSRPFIWASIGFVLNRFSFVLHMHISAILSSREMFSS